MIEVTARATSDCCSVPCFKEEEVARVRAALPADGELAAIGSLFALLADPMRLRIVLALSNAEELCVCDVANVIGLSLSATSHHLRKLREAGIVTFRNDGKMAWYRLLDGFPVGLALQARVWRRQGASTKAQAGCCP